MPNPIDPQLLNQLHDIQLPQAIGWWPLAFSWWILILSITSIVIGIAWYIREQRRRNAYRRKALKKLLSIQSGELHPAEKIAKMNALMKQVALTTYGRMEVAALQQQAWLDFLHQKASYISQPDCLADSLQKAYAGPVGADIEHFQIENCARYFAKWIKGHHQ